jgi:hypothetical protein
MAGGALGIGWLREFGRVSGASPAPLGFSHLGGMEPFATRLTVTYTDAGGHRVARPLDAASYAALDGPLNRRYAYIRSLHYGALLQHEQEIRGLRYALCPGGGLARIWGLERPGAAPVLTARTLTAGARRTWDLPIACPE